jgi:hypothetical protein
VNVINAGWEEAADYTHLNSGKPSNTTDVEHEECVHSMLEHTCNIPRTATGAEVGILPASMFHILIKHLGE